MSYCPKYPQCHCHGDVCSDWPPLPTFPKSKPRKKKIFFAILEAIGLFFKDLKKRKNQSDGVQ